MHFGEDTPLTDDLLFLLARRFGLQDNVSGDNLCALFLMVMCRNFERERKREETFFE